MKTKTKNNEQKAEISAFCSAFHFSFCFLNFCFNK